MRFICPDAEPQYRDLIESSCAPLRRAGHTFEVYEGAPAGESEWERRVDGANGIFSILHVPDAVLAMPGLEVVSWAGTGVRRFIDLEQAAKADVTVCNVPNYGANAVAEHALALMLAAARHVAEGDRLIRSGGWRQRTGRELRGSRLGIVGAGPIGQRMAEIGRGLGMEVVAWTRSPSAERAAELGVEFLSLEVLMATCDFVSVHVAHTKETEGLLDRDTLGALKRSAVLVNTARGELLDSAALAERLAAGELFGVGADVFETEPPPADHPLLATERTVLTPHLGYDTDAALGELFHVTATNLLSYAEGRPQNVVTASG